MPTTSSMEPNKKPMRRTIAVYVIHMIYAAIMFLLLGASLTVLVYSFAFPQHFPPLWLLIPSTILLAGIGEYFWGRRQYGFFFLNKKRINQGKLSDFMVVTGCGLISAGFVIVVLLRNDDLNRQQASWELRSTTLHLNGYNFANIFPIGDNPLWYHAEAMKDTTGFVVKDVSAAEFAQIFDILDRKGFRKINVPIYALPQKGISFKKPFPSADALVLFKSLPKPPFGAAVVYNSTKHTLIFLLVNGVGI